MEKFRPLSPDPFIIDDADMTVARFGHINAIVEAINGTIPSVNGIMYQSQYDPFNTGIVHDSYLFNSELPSYYLDRANHTGTQPQSSVVNLITDLASKGDMFKNVYDPDLNGIVDNSSALNSFPGSYYLTRSNHTGTQAQSTITNLTSDLLLKEDKSNKGVALGYCELDASGKVPNARLNISAFNYKNSWNALTNIPVLADGIGASGDIYLVGVGGTQDLGSGSITFAVGDMVVYDGLVWGKISAALPGVLSVNGFTNVVNLTTDDIPEGTLFYLTQDQRDALNATFFAPSAGNPFVTENEITNLNLALATKGDMFKITYDTNNNGIVDNSERLNNQLPSFYLDLGNHTGFIAQSNVTNLITTLALKEDKANKGVANGYCDLDATGKVPLSRLNIAGLNYQNSWNAFTNSPFIANGIGNTGDTYIVGVAGTRNLGSGSIVFNVGDLVIYSSTGVWQKIGTTAIGVSSWNGLSGAVSATTANLPESTDKNYVTDLQLDALNNADNPSATNYFITVSDLDSVATVVAGIMSDIIDINNDLALKENKSEKGIANGYCDLDASGKVPASRLNFNAINYQNSWNATTNSPTLADGIGTSGDAYLVGVAGSQNLGSGIISFSVGDLVIYNGIVWQKITAGGIGVSSVNGFTGAVTLTADNIAETSSRFYVTALQNAALDAAPNPSGSNRFALLSDIPSSPTSTPYVTPQQYGALNATTRFVDLGINQATIDLTYPGIGAVITDTVDWASLQYAINESLANNKPLRTYGTYYINKALIVQPTAYEVEWVWEGGGATINTTNNNAFTVVTIGVATQQETTPLVPSDAMWLVNNTYNVSRLKVYINSNQIAFNFGPSYSSRYEQLLVSGNGSDSGIKAIFNLNAVFANCNIRGCLNSLRLSSGFGLWINATTSNSQCNHTTIENCRVSWQDVSTPAETGFDIVDASGVTISDSIIEGTRVKKGINLYSELTTVLTFNAKNMHYECTQGTATAGNNQAFFYSRTLGGLFTLDNIYGQYACILADTGISTGGGSTTLKLSNTRYWVAQSSKAFYNAGNTTYISDFNDEIFFLSASWPGLVAGTAISLCGGIGCGNNKYSHYPIPR